MFMEYADPFNMRDDRPDDGEIRAAVVDLNNERAGGASQIRAKHIKAWLRGAKEADKAEENGRPPSGDTQENASC